VVAVHHSSSTSRMLLTTCGAACAGLTKEEEGFKDAVAATLLPMVRCCLGGWQALFHDSLLCKVLSCAQGLLMQLPARLGG
jgi:hypothetical protein